MRARSLVRQCSSTLNNKMCCEMTRGGDVLLPSILLLCMLYIYSAFIHSWILALAVLSVIHVSVVQLLWHGIIIGKIFHIRFVEFHFF